MNDIDAHVPKELDVHLVVDNYATHKTPRVMRWLPSSDGGSTHVITGNLELHGVTKAIRFPANIRLTSQGVEVDSEFAINRKDFGITYPGKVDDLIKDHVLLKLTIRTTRPAA